MQPDSTYTMRCAAARRSTFVGVRNVPPAPPKRQNHCSGTASAASRAKCVFRDERRREAPRQVAGMYACTASDNITHGHSSAHRKARNASGSGSSVVRLADRSAAWQADTPYIKAANNKVHVITAFYSTRRSNATRRTRHYVLKPTTALRTVGARRRCSRDVKEPAFAAYSTPPNALGVTPLTASGQSVRRNGRRENRMKEGTVSEQRQQQSTQCPEQGKRVRP